VSTGQIFNVPIELHRHPYNMRSCTAVDVWLRSTMFHSSYILIISISSLSSSAILESCMGIRMTGPWRWKQVLWDTVRM